MRITTVENDNYLIDSKLSATGRIVICPPAAAISLSLRGPRDYGETLITIFRDLPTFGGHITFPAGAACNGCSQMIGQSPFCLAQRDGLSKLIHPFAPCKTPTFVGVHLRAFIALCS